jgi:hypothetical protein
LGFRWDPIRGLWEPTETLTENRTELALAPTENFAEFPVLQSIGVEPDLDRNSSTENTNEVAKGTANVRDATDQVMWKDFRVTDDGCLFPKQTPRLDKDGSSFKRPKGAAPLGFRWDPVRGLWAPTESLTLTENQTQFTPTPTENAGEPPVFQPFDMEPDRDRNAHTEGKTNELAGRNTADQVKWNDCKVTDDGCLFPKQTPKRNKDGSTFKRPKGPAPLGFRWDPRRGLWERCTDSEINVVEKADRTLRERVMDELIGGETWKGYAVTADGSLLPRKEPKREEKDGSLFKRPPGAAPRGFRWNAVLGVWEGDFHSERPPAAFSTRPQATLDTASDPGSSHMNQQSNNDSSPLLNEQPTAAILYAVFPNSAIEVAVSLVLGAINCTETTAAVSEIQSLEPLPPTEESQRGDRDVVLPEETGRFYPKRSPQARTLQRYSPSLTEGGRSS